MLVKKIFNAFFFLAVLIGAVSIEAAPKRYYVDDGTQTALRELRDGMDDLRHEMTNHTSEIQVFEETLNTYEVTIDGLRQQIVDGARTNQQVVKERTDQLDMRLSSLESNLRGLIADMQQFKTHSQENAALLARTKQKIDELEKLIEAQNQNVENLQSAMGSLSDVLQINKGDTSAKTYKVKPGDSLEKIARHHQTSIYILKELNNLTNDKIIVGQTLKLP